MILACYRGRMAGKEERRSVRFGEELSTERTGLSVQGKPPAMRPGREPDSPAAMRPGSSRR